MGNTSFNPHCVVDEGYPVVSTLPKASQKLAFFYPLRRFCGIELPQFHWEDADIPLDRAGHASGLVWCGSSDGNDGQGGMPCAP